MNGLEQVISVVVPVYRDGKRAIAAARAMLEQTLPDGFVIEVLLVDDGSDDDTPELLRQLNDACFRVISLTQNQGRSVARNAGAHESRGEVIVFMDCDCVPKDETFLAAHLDVLTRPGVVASTGHVTGAGTGFWDRYQCEASLRREQQHALGAPWAGSSQNMAVSKAAFTQIGGFDAEYRQYGFEDRDLLLRLAQFGQVAWAKDAVVRHIDVLCLSEVSRKMVEAGTHTASRFALAHPDAYVALGYAAIDARVHPWLRIPGSKIGPLLASIASSVETMLHRRWMPYAFARGLVKLVSAVSFIHGTTRVTNQ